MSMSAAAAWPCTAIAASATASGRRQRGRVDVWFMRELQTRQAAGHRGIAHTRNRPQGRLVANGDGSGRNAHGKALDHIDAGAGRRVRRAHGHRPLGVRAEGGREPLAGVGSRRRLRRRCRRQLELAKQPASCAPVGIQLRRRESALLAGNADPPGSMPSMGDGREADSYIGAPSPFMSYPNGAALTCCVRFGHRSRPRAAEQPVDRLVGGADRFVAPLHVADRLCAGQRAAKDRQRHDEEHQEKTSETISVAPFCCACIGIIPSGRRRCSVAPTSTSSVRLKPSPGSSATFGPNW